MEAQVSGPIALAKGLAPFVLATLLGFALVVLTASIDGAEFAAALALTGVVVAATCWLPWRRLPESARMLPSLLFLVSMALLRDAGGGTTSGVGALVLLPVFWMSLHGTRAQLAVVVVGVAAFFLAPIVLVGGAGYPASGARTAIILVAISAIIGHAVQRLVRQVRRHADRARRHTADLQRVAAVSRRIALGDDARAEVCSAACELGGATFAFFMEPRDGGGLASTAMVGLDAPQVSSGRPGEWTPTLIAFTTAEPLFIADVHSYGAKDDDVWRRHGGPAAMLFEPLLSGGRPAGVLVVGWATGRQPRRRPEIMTMLAAEAVHAIERADLVDELTDLASTDALTGLLNRRVWDEQLEQALTETDGRPVSVAILDLDNFKAFNDSRGHQAGDRLLKEAAAAWRAVLRPGDMLARYGGEEFAVLLSTCDDALAAQVLERLRDATPGGQTCSGGIARWDGHESGEQLLARADRALYAAKAAGRDRVLSA